MTALTVFSSHEYLIEKYSNVAEGIALLFSEYVEVVLHSLESQSVIYIANNISKRKLGSPSNLEEIEFDEEESVIGPYEKVNWDGNKVKSISIVLRSAHKEAIGLLCINFITTELYSAMSSLNRLLKGVQLIEQPEKLFKNDWQERINTFINNWATQNNTDIQKLSRIDKRKIVSELYISGAFKEKKSQDYVSNVLNMGRTTIFKYLKEHKKSQ